MLSDKSLKRTRPTLSPEKSLPGSPGPEHSSKRSRRRTCSSDSEKKSSKSKRTQSTDHSSKKRAQPSEKSSERDPLKKCSRPKAKVAEEKSKDNNEKPPKKCPPRKAKAASSTILSNYFYHETISKKPVPKAKASKVHRKLEPAGTSKSKHKLYDHLSEEERKIVLGLGSSHSSTNKNVLGKAVSESKDSLPSGIKTREPSSKTATASTETRSVPFSGISDQQSSTSATKVSSTTTTTHSLMPVISSQTTSRSISLTSASTVSLSTSVQKSVSETPQSQLNSSVLMQVSKHGKMVFVNPFLPSSPLPVTNRSHSHSVIVIEDSPLNKTPISHSTSTPRPSSDPPALNLFPSPIVFSNTFVQTPSCVHSVLELELSDSTNDTTVINKSSAGSGAFIVQSQSLDSTEEMEFITIDEEDMEVDDEIAMNTLIDARENTMHMESETVGTLTEMVAEKSILFSETIEELQNKTESSYGGEMGFVVLIIDTNVFIAALSFVIEALKRASSGDLLVLLPWVVLQELDYLKQHNKNIRFTCMKAVRFINEQLLADNPYLMSQTPQQSMEKIIPIENNDDKILVCCLQRIKNYKKDRVILVTRDINLSSKARVSGIESSSNENLWNLIGKPDKQQGNKEQNMPHNDNRNPPTENLNKIIPQNANNNRPPSHNINNIIPQNANNNPPPSYNINNNVPYNNHKGNPPRPVYKPNQREERAICQPQMKWKNVLKKFLSVWELIDIVRLEVTRDLNWGPNHPDFIRGGAMADTMLETTGVLYEQFHRCLMLSPIHISNFPFMFDRLKYLLENFYAACKVTRVDTSEHVLTEDIMNYFHETANRPYLLSRLEQLQDFKDSFRCMLRR